MPTELNVPEIDFLPIEFRAQELHRRSHGWRAIVIVGFAGVLSVTTAYLRLIKVRAQAELDRVTQIHTEATDRTNHLGQLNSKLKPATDEAELLTYLRHPWPRSQLVAAIVRDQPEGILLSKLHLTREAIVRPASPTAAPVTVPTEAEKAQLAQASPAAQDLRKLKAECDEFRTEILIEGTAREVAGLHEYLHHLGKDPLFTKVELGLVQALANPAQPSGQAETTPTVFKFAARFTVKPGYGQAGGPEPTKHEKQRANIAISITAHDAAQVIDSHLGR